MDFEIIRIGGMLCIRNEFDDDSTWTNIPCRLPTFLALLSMSYMPMRRIELLFWPDWSSPINFVSPTTFSALHEGRKCFIFIRREVSSLHVVSLSLLTAFISLRSVSLSANLYAPSYSLHRDEYSLTLSNSHRAKLTKL